MKRIIISIITIVGVLMLHAQEREQHEILDSIYFFQRSILSESDEEYLKGLNTLRLPTSRENIHLPFSVNNGNTLYFPPIFYQAALECGQASSITYAFTYEIAIRRNYIDITYSNAHHFPSHFAWNFCNGGISTGVSFMDTWQVVRTAGCPFTPAWGGAYTSGGASKWMTGYNLYYNAMKNRIVEMLAIPTDSEEGILTLKHWLFDHMCGDEHGGVANFYSTYKSADAHLPTGTPEAGFALMSTFSNTVNHSQTIVGYNDSIRYDFNGDGVYTNNIDINGDGIVNVKDWEIGGVLFCNTFGTPFGTGGFCYMPYKRLAEIPSEGGIWNKCVYVVNVKDEVFPQLTAKATIKHDTRNMLRITAGFSSDITAITPDKTLSLNVFNYQGGALPMQGGSTEADETLELGLDLSPFLNDLDSNHTYKFFLVVDEDDPSGIGSGQIINFSLMDYTEATPTESICLQSNVPIANNTTTYLTINKTINFSKPVIQSSEINTNAFSDFSIPLSATEGKPPYRWELSKEYNIEEFNADYPTPATIPVSLSSNSNGYTLIDLPFDFPCFGETHRQIYLYADGFITFKYNYYNWPFLKNSSWQLQTTQMLAPFRGDLVLTSIMKDFDSHSFTLSITGNISGQSSNSIHFTVKLYDTGVIEYYYGDMSYAGQSFIAVHSYGNAVNYVHLPISGKNASVTAHRNFRLTPPKSIDGLNITRNGVVYGRFDRPLTWVPIDITCFDNNDVKTTKTLYVNSIYPAPIIITNVEVDANGKEEISIGDTVTLSITIRNVDSMAFDGCLLTFSTADEYVTMLDSNEYFGYIAAGNEYTLNNSITFIVENNTPNEHILEFNTLITNNSEISSAGTQVFVVSSYSFSFVDYYFSDLNNNTPQPNETLNAHFTLKNSSDNSLEDLEFRLRFADSNITVTAPLVQIAHFPEDYEQTLVFELQTNSQFIEEDVKDAYIDVYVHNNHILTLTAIFVCDKECHNFETGVFPSEYDNNTPSDSASLGWVISGESPYHGLYSLSSGAITHEQKSSFSFSANFTNSGIINFGRKVNSENNYDWLSFYIDGELQMRWSGTHDWEIISIPFEVGSHTFTWTYSKDYSVSTGLDKAWIDDICISCDNSVEPNLEISPSNFHVEIVKGHTLDTILRYQAMTNHYVIFENSILDDNLLPTNWATIDYTYGSINALQERNLTLHFNTANKNIGQTYQAKLIAQVEEGNNVQIPIEMKVLTNVGIEEINEDNGWEISPNPTTDMVRIESLQFSGDEYYILHNISGQQLEKEAITDANFYIHMENYPAGIYFITLKSRKNITKTMKIIKL